MEERKEFNRYIPRQPLKLYEPCTHDELMKALREHKRSANKVNLQIDLNGDEPRYIAEYKILPMVLDAETDAIALEVLRWAEEHGYDVRFIDEKTVRDICEKMAPVKPMHVYAFSIMLNQPRDWECGKCYCPLLRDFKFCPGCGTRIDWED